MDSEGQTRGDFLGSQIESTHCAYCENEPSVVFRYYDIRVGTTGRVSLCGEHYKRRGPIPENYFWCDECKRLVLKERRWEHYYDDADDRCFCIDCHRRKELPNPENWIQLTENDIVGLEFDRVLRAKHLLVAGQVGPSNLKRLGGIEFDRDTGGPINSPNDPPPLEIQQIRGLLTEARNSGYSRAILILEAVCVHWVRVGVYVQIAPEPVAELREPALPPEVNAMLARGREHVSAIEELMSFLYCPDPEVRSQAMQALRRLLG